MTTNNAAMEKAFQAMDCTDNEMVKVQTKQGYNMTAVVCIFVASSVWKPPGKSLSTLFQFVGLFHVRVSWKI